MFCYSCIICTVEIQLVLIDILRRNKYIYIVSLSCIFPEVCEFA